MALTAKSTKISEFYLVPPGSYLARCYRILDLGTQKTLYKGTESYKHQVMLTFEVHGDDDEGKALQTSKGEPLSISKNYTFSMNEKSNLRKDLESWRAKKFPSDSEANKFDLKNVLGVWGLVAVIHTDKSDKVYANIDSIMKVPDQMKKNLPEGFNPLSMFDLEDPDMSIFETLSERIQEKIKSSPEWSTVGEREIVEVIISDDDDIPF